MLLLTADLDRYADSLCLHIRNCVSVPNLTAKQELHPHEQNTRRKAGAKAAQQRVLRMGRRELWMVTKIFTLVEYVVADYGSLDGSGISAEVKAI